MRRLTAAACATLLCWTACVLTGPARAAAQASAPQIHVAGNQLVDATGHSLRLLGVDRSGSEFGCIQGWGIFDGPTDATSIAAIAAWHVNAVRIPLNEDCWLGINGVRAAYGGAAYQAAIAGFVSRLNAAGMVAILDLHWTAPGTTPATGQEPMPDADHSVTFWTQVATAYAGNRSTVFDLFNEPYPAATGDTPAAWACLRDGGAACAGQLIDTSGKSMNYTAAGMQQLVNAVRATGAPNVVMAPGLQWTGTLDHWLQYEPVDPLHQLAASWHNYNFGGCVDPSCWSAQLGPVLAAVPVVTGEIGEDDCAGTYITSVMDWLDSHGASYLAWTWDVWNCTGGPSLISDYSGTPTAFGTVYRDHLATVTRSSPPPFTPEGVGAPAVAVTPDGSTQLVFWRDSSGLLTEAWYANGWNGPVELPQFGALASAPTVAVAPDGTQLVFWEGTGGHLMEAWYAGGWHGPVDWTASTFAGRGLLGSAPTVAVLPSGKQVVFWRGAGGKLTEAWFDGRWNGPVEYGPYGQLASAPTVAIAPGGSAQVVFWQGLDNHLHEAWYEGGWNGPADWSALGTLASAPSAAITTDGTQLLFFEDAGGHLVEDWYRSGWNGPVDWTAAAFSGKAPLSSPPAVAAMPSGTQQLVFWRGAGASLCEAWFNGGWNGPVDYSAP